MTKKMRSPSEGMPLRGSVVYLRDVPEDTKTQFKALCILRHTTITQEIIRLMKDELRRHRTQMSSVGNIDD